MTEDKKSDMLVLAEAMDNLADALRQNRQVLLAMQEHTKDAPSDTKQLQDAVYELAQRIAVLSTRLR